MSFISFSVLQLEIIDACVNYIEALQSQLDIVKPTKNLRDVNDISDEDDDDDDDEENDVMNNNNVQNDRKSNSPHLWPTLIQDQFISSLFLCFLNLWYYIYNCYLSINCY